MIWNIFRDLDNIFCFADGNKNIENAIFFADEQKYKNVNNLYFYKRNLNTSSFGTDTTREIKKFYNFLNLEMFYIFKNLKKGTKQKILIILNCVFWKLKQKFWAPNSEILPNLIKFNQI